MIWWCMQQDLDRIRYLQVQQAIVSHEWLYQISGKLTWKHLLGWTSNNCCCVVVCVALMSVKKGLTQKNHYNSGVKITAPGKTEGKEQRLFWLRLLRLLEQWTLKYVFILLFSPDSFMWKFPPKKLCRRNNGRIPPNFEQTIIDRYEKCMPIFFRFCHVANRWQLFFVAYKDTYRLFKPTPISYLFSSRVTQRDPPPYCRHSKWQRKQGAHPQRKTQSKAKVSRSTSNNYFFLFFWFSFTSNFSRRRRSGKS